MKKLYLLVITMIAMSTAASAQSIDLTPYMTSIETEPSSDAVSEPKNEHPFGGMEISFMKPEAGGGYEYYIGGIDKYFFLGFGMIYGKQNEYIRNNNFWRLGGGCQIRKYLTDFLYFEGRAGLYYGHSKYEYVSGMHTEYVGVYNQYSHDVKDWSTVKDGDVYFDLKPAIGIDFSKYWGIIVGYDMMWYKFKLNSDNRLSFWTFGISLNI